jgi:hypothetical protein
MAAKIQQGAAKKKGPASLPISRSPVLGLFYQK